MGRERKAWRRGSGQGRQGSLQERKGVIERAFVLQSRYPLIVPPQTPPSLTLHCRYESFLRVSTFSYSKVSPTWTPFEQWC